MLQGFAWLSEPGVYYGGFNLAAAEGLEEGQELHMLANHRLLPYQRSDAGSQTAPLSVVGVVLQSD